MFYECELIQQQEKQTIIYLNNTCRCALINHLIVGRGDDVINITNDLKI
jgi:hypothetical protein